MTVDELRAQIDRLETAAAAVSRNKSYTIDGLTYTRQDLAAIQSRLDALYSRLACVLRGAVCHRASSVRPIDHVRARGTR